MLGEEDRGQVLLETGDLSHQRLEYVGWEEVAEQVREDGHDLVEISRRGVLVNLADGRLEVLEHDLHLFSLVFHGSRLEIGARLDRCPVEKLDARREAVSQVALQDECEVRQLEGVGEEAELGPVHDMEDIGIGGALLRVWDN